MNMTPTSFVAIESDCGRFELTDLFRDDYCLYQTPSLMVREFSSKGGRELEFWDNPDYILRLFRSLETDTHTTEFLDLIFFCAQNEWDLDEVGSTLLAIYKLAKELKMFKEC